MQKWISFCRRGNTFNPKTSHICMMHFANEDFENSLKYNMGFTKKRALKRGAFPTIYQASNENLERAERLARRENRQVVAMLLQDDTVAGIYETNEYIDVPIEDTCELVECGKENCSLESNRHASTSKRHAVQEIQALEEQIDALHQENLCLKWAIQKHCSAIETLKQDSAKRDRKNAYDNAVLEERLAKAENANRNIEDKMECIFTKGQLSKLTNCVKSPTWTEEDIAQSITLYAVSPKAYKFMYRKGFPLPAVRTIQKWSQKIDISRGLIQPVIKNLKASTQMTELQKLCVLCFDEIKIRRTYCYDQSSDTTLAPANYVQVAMLRGLMAKWKQPIFYDFDCKMTPQILQDILHVTADSGYTIIAMVCDLGGGNRGLMNQLQVNEDKPWFLFNDQKVFVFADVPHLIKLVRNHFLDNGFTIDGKSVKKEVIVDLLTCTSSDLTITHKISPKHLEVSGAQRQNVKMATKLFSHVGI